MKKPHPLRKLLLCLTLFVSHYVFSQAPANNTCAGAVTLSVSGDCSATAGDMYLATQTSPTGSSCGNRYDVWYKFTMPATSTFAKITVTLTSNPSSLATNNTYIELFNTTATGTCTSVNSNSTGGCNDISSPRTYTGLTPGGTYYFRINTTLNPNTNPTRWGFTVCVTSNDNCATATTLTPGTTFNNGNVFGASNSGIAVGACSGNPDDDVWFKFTAAYNYATILLTNVGSSLNTSGPRMQLFSGTCGSLTAIDCGTYGLNTTALTPGNTYYVRVYAAGTGQSGFNLGNSGFRISLTPSTPTVVGSGRMKEVYQQQILSAPQVLADPWEVTYGPDGDLWITESKGYRVYHMNSVTGAKDTVLDINQGSTFLGDPSYNVQANVISNGPQGGLAGLALHPKFLDATAPKNFAYVSYIYSFQSNNDPNGVFYTNRLVRFTYNTSTKKFESPVIICDTLPGSNDHNSQRVICAPVGGTYYLFYAGGDMGAGQFANRLRINKAQNPNSYEGKILRFNLEPDADPGLAAWIPNDNPYSANSAVWSIGIRNNQGFVYDSINNILYGSSHGPYSDDEINIIERRKNYGHPIVIGYASDGNYDGTTGAGLNTSVSAGAPFSTSSGASSCPAVGSESANVAIINGNGNGAYKDPLFSAYPGPLSGTGSVANIWATTTGANGNWPSEGWSGLDLYKHTLIPGWKNSLIACSLKWGRLLRLKLNEAGDSVCRTAGADTISYFGSTNRFRDMAVAPNGKDFYVIMDRSATTSGPSANNPVVPACGGCLQKYTFLGYADASGKSSIHDSIPVSYGVPNGCATGTQVTINSANANTNMWVPITGPDGNIMAEIYANGNNLGVVTSSFYKNVGPLRIKNGNRYLNRNITITPATQPGSTVKVRFYFSKAEFDALKADPLSSINTINDIRIIKNSDPCSPSVIASGTLIAPTVAEVHSDTGYVVQANISSFSSFYFGSTNITLPVTLLNFKGTLQNNATLLQWETSNEINTSYFVVERSIDSRNFGAIGTVAASGNTNSNVQYSYIDNDVTTLPATVIYYRLRMVDIDGSFKYSNVVVITLNDIAGKVTVSPNPATHDVKLSVVSDTEGNAQWKIIDNSGRVVMQSSMSLKKGTNNMKIDISKLAGGIYYLSVTSDGIDQKVKLQKL